EQTLPQWLRLVARPWSDEDNGPNVFHRTAVAGKWRGDGGSCVPESPSEVQEYERIRNMMCAGRRMVTNQTHKAFWLANADVKKGDLICVLFGAAVPFILREAVHSNWRFMGHDCGLICRRNVHRKCCFPTLYTLVGQIYVDDLMHN